MDIFIRQVIYIFVAVKGCVMHYERFMYSNRLID